MISRALSLALILATAACTREEEVVRVATPCELMATDGSKSTLEFGRRYHLQQRLLGASQILVEGRPAGTVDARCLAPKLPGASAAIVADPSVGLREDPGDLNSRLSELNAGRTVDIAPVSGGSMVLVAESGVTLGYAVRTAFVSPATPEALAGELQTRSQSSLPWAIESFVRLPDELRSAPPMLAFLHGLAPRHSSPEDAVQLARAYLRLAGPTLPPLVRDEICRFAFESPANDIALEWAVFEACGRRPSLSDVIGERAEQLPAWSHAKCPDGREPIMDKSDSTEEAMVCASGQHAEVYVSDLKHLLSVGTLDAAGDDKPCRPQVMQLAVGDFTVCVETRDYGYDCEKPLAAPAALSRWLCFLPSPATPAPPPIRVPLDRGERVGWTSDSCERNCPVQWTQTTRPLARAEPVPSVTRMLLCVAGAEEDAKHDHFAWQISHGEAKRVTEAPDCAHFWKENE